MGHAQKARHTSPASNGSSTIMIYTSRRGKRTCTSKRSFDACITFGESERAESARGMLETGGASDEKAFHEIVGDGCRARREQPGRVSQIGVPVLVRYLFIS